MRKRLFGRRALAAALSLMLALPGNLLGVSVFAAGTSETAAKATASDAAKASASDAALLDEDGLLMDGEVVEDVILEAPEVKTEQIGKALAGEVDFYLEPGEMMIQVGETYSFGFIAEPASILSGGKTWKSSDPSVASIDQSGGIVGLKGGTTIISLEAGGYTATATLIVYEEDVAVTSIDMNTTSRKLCRNQTFQLKAWAKPVDASDRSVTWKSSNASVATVSSTGLVTAKSDGTAVITATSVSNPEVKGTCTITVKSVTSLVINTAACSVNKGKTFQLKAWPQPTDAANRNVTWKSSNSSIATVDSNGLVTGVAAGTANITATTVDGGFTKTCKVTVKIPVTSVKINTTSRTINQGATFQLAAWPQPTNATNRTVTWSSSNTAVATVSSTGLVKGVKAGTATITVKTNDGGFTQKCTITVKANVPVTSVKINSTAKTLIPKKTFQLKAWPQPTNASDRSVTWTSSNTSVATVSSNGLVTAVKKGTATITARSVNGKTATCTITVIANQFITVSGNKKYVNSDGSYAKGLVTYNNALYYCDNNANMVTNYFLSGTVTSYYFGSDGKAVGDRWVTIDGKPRYFETHGPMAKNCFTPDGYRVGADGSRVSEKQYSPSKYYDHSHYYSCWATGSGGRKDATVYYNEKSGSFKIDSFTIDPSTNDLKITYSNTGSTVIKHVSIIASRTESGGKTAYELYGVDISLPSSSSLTEKTIFNLSSAENFTVIIDN